jgi:hypothetical protein
LRPVDEKYQVINENTSLAMVESTNGVLFENKPDNG